MAYSRCLIMKNKPRIRFKGFTEDWEQRKLGDYLSIPEKEILEVDSSDDLITVKLNLGGVELGASRDTLSLGSTVYYKRYAGQFIYGKQNFFNGSMGLIPTNLDGKGSSGDVPSFNISNIEENYLYTYVSRESYWRSKVAAASGTGSKRIHEKTFLDFNIDVPSMDEQKLISNTFDLVDRFITLHQRKLEKLKLAKKALLQKLFPKNGSKFPELRFKGFANAWEQRKLDELTISIGDGLHGTPKYDENGSYYFINGNNLVDSKVSVTEETKKVAFEALSNDDRRLDSTSILMSINGTIGTLARYNNENIMLGKSVAYITPKNINRDFLFYQLQGNVIQSYFYKNLTGTTIKNLGLGTIKNAIVMSTLSEEESKIGQFFYKLDQYITLHQRKLDKLQEVKKGLLQKMFV